MTTASYEMCQTCGHHAVAHSTGECMATYENEGMSQCPCTKFIPGKPESENQ